MAYTTTPIIRRRETKWEKRRRIAKLRMNAFWRESKTKMIVIGLPLIGLFAGIFIGTAVTTYTQSAKLNDFGRHMVYTSYTVKADDTIWGIAEDLIKVNPEYKNIPQYVKEIKNVNNLRDDEIKYGQKIILPYFVGADGIVNYNEIYSRYGIN